ncbi:tetratricopeptide repeat protein [Saccharothrix sp. AJ9571]|nr:tetratricopeptide repeat protein [Saccharothrix sp. AJ9571]
MRFGVLGPLEVRTAAGAPVGVPELKVRALLAALLVHRGRPVSADRLIDDLWGDRPPANPPASLQTKVSRLRQAIGRDLVVAEAPGYRLVAESVDADEFTALISRARAAGDPRVRADLLTEALALWRGPAFSGFDDEEFARTTIDRLAEQRLAVVEALAEARLDLGEHSLLAGELGELVAQHPLRERLRAAHLRALYRSGRQSDALAGYEDLRSRLADELGLDPSTELVELHQAMLEQSPALEAPRPSTNLPSSLTPLIGRADTVAEVGKSLADHRLVTLTGPGGVGKTRLAWEVAAGIADAWLIESTVDSLADAVATTLGLRDEPLAEALRNRRLLLVLDNCERALDEVAELASSLLKAAPGLRVLATSRSPIGIAGEVIHEVVPLPEADAVELFLSRAAALGFTTDELAAVRTICARLDGLPLAVELAAARVRTLGVTELLARLDDRFRLLAKGMRDAPLRHRTLRATLDWSWEPLSEAERTVLRQLSVHVGGCTLEAAEAVCETEDVAELLDSLVDRSLVFVRDGRFRMLESVIAYCAEKGELDTVHRRHREYYHRLAERADLRGPEQAAWLERLDVEHPNLRKARVGKPLAWYWVMRGRFAEVQRHVPDALPLGLALFRSGEDLARSEKLVNDAIQTTKDEWELAVALSVRAAQAFTRGDLAAVERDAAESARMFRGLGDRWGQLQSAYALSALAEVSGDYPEAARLHREGLRLAEELGLGADAADRLTGLGRIALLTGDLDEARALHERARRQSAELGYRAGEVHAELGLALIARRAGDLELAEATLRSVLAWHREAKFDPGPALVFAELGFVAELRGDVTEALALQQKALKAAERTGDPRAIALSLEGLACAHSLAGDQSEARRLLSEATARRESVGAPLPPAERGDIARALGRE